MEGGQRNQDTKLTENVSLVLSIPRFALNSLLYLWQMLYLLSGLAIGLLDWDNLKLQVIFYLEGCKCEGGEGFEMGTSSEVVKSPGEHGWKL